MCQFLLENYKIREQTKRHTFFLRWQLLRCHFETSTNFEVRRRIILVCFCYFGVLCSVSALKWVLRAKKMRNHRLPVCWWTMWPPGAVARARLRRRSDRPPSGRFRAPWLRYLILRVTIRMCVLWTRTRPPPTKSRGSAGVSSTEPLDGANAIKRFARETEFWNVVVFLLWFNYHHLKVHWEFRSNHCSFKCVYNDLQALNFVLVILFQRITLHHHHLRQTTAPTLSPLGKMTQCLWRMRTLPADL